MFSLFAKGFLKWFQGLLYLFKKPVLWKYCIIPLLINTLLILCLFYYGSGFLFDFLPDSPFDRPLSALPWLSWIWAWIRESFQYFLYVFLYIGAFLLFAVLAGISFFVLATVIGSPFYEMLTEKIEAMNGLEATKTVFSVKRNILYPILNSLKISVFSLIFAVLFFPLNWIPLVGTLAYCLLMSFPTVLNLINYLTERRLWKFRVLLKYLWLNRLEFSGFGLMALFSMMPFWLNMFTLPVSVTGAALLFIENQKKQTEDKLDGNG